MYTARQGRLRGIYLTYIKPVVIPQKLVTVEHLKNSILFMKTHISLESGTSTVSKILNTQPVINKRVSERPILFSEILVVGVC